MSSTNKFVFYKKSPKVIVSAATCWIFVAFILILPISSYSQNYKFQAGAIGGMTGTQISGDGLSGFNKIGLIGGIFTNHQLSDKFYGEMEIIFFQKGSRKTANPKQGDFTRYLLRLNYVEVPLLIQYKEEKFTFETGPSFGRLISRKEKVNGVDYTNETQSFKDFEISWNFGINYALNENFLLEARFNNSISAVRGKNNIRPQFESRLKRGQFNSSIALVLKYHLNNLQN
ncbi:MAG: porin family protein [Flavobacteriales bacterium]